MALCRFLFFVILKSPPTSDSDFSRSDREPIKVPIKRKALNQLTRELGHEDRFSVYVHASREKPVHTSHYFIGRDIHRETVLKRKEGKRKRNFQRMGGHCNFG
ncbi:uncharacterized protein [Gossypium hirsutum]|uniref:Uncharacterized protein isoform X3 n=1 Tax=Gossypium hirsutum TaxID=3635 RepID=A0ABM3BHJ8_GOSHI|nr:uncharacterized protein LOC107939599 isoform X3 [Gossypium hirsutum]